MSGRGRGGGVLEDGELIRPQPDYSRFFEDAFLPLAEAIFGRNRRTVSHCLPLVCLVRRSALRSVIVRLRLQCFFLVLPEKVVVRLCEAEDSGGPLLGRFVVVGKKCAANLDLTNGFRMAVNAHPRALQTIAAE
eukprot:XP_027303650.1 uncharacterized protein LOC113841128 isoform X1 [Anas platyrhynchos]